MPKHVVMYSAQLCSDCQKLKAFLDANHVCYETRDIKVDPENMRELEKKTGKLGVPYLVIDGEWVRGYEPGQPFSEAYARSILGLED